MTRKVVFVLVMLVTASVFAQALQHVSFSWGGIYTEAQFNDLFRDRRIIPGGLLRTSNLPNAVVSEIDTFLLALSRRLGGISVGVTYNFNGFYSGVWYRVSFRVTNSHTRAWHFFAWSDR